MGSGPPASVSTHPSRLLSLQPVRDRARHERTATRMARNMGLPAASGRWRGLLGTLHAVDPIARTRYISQYPRAAGGAQHANRELRPVAAPHEHRTRRGGAERRERQQVARAQFDRIRSRGAGHGDRHALIQLPEPYRGLNGKVDTGRNIGCSHAVAVAVDEHPEGDAGGAVFKAESHVRGSHDGLGSGNRHPGCQEAGSRHRPRAIDGRERLRYRDRGHRRHDRARKQELDDAVARQPVAESAVAGSLEASDYHRSHSRPGYCAAARSFRSGVIVTSAFSLRKLASPIPRTFISSSIFLKPPFCCRYSTIRCAVAGPTPGSASSSAIVAVFKFTVDCTVDVFAAGARPASCAADVVPAKPSTISAAIIILITSPPVVILVPWHLRSPAHSTVGEVGRRCMGKRRGRVETWQGGRRVVSNGSVTPR